MRARGSRVCQAAVPTEHAEQVSLLRWWEYRARPEERPLLMAIPNGGARTAVTGAMLKAEGVRAGVPDMLLALPRNGHAGLWIELKRVKGGRVSGAQKAMLAALAGAGYATAVCHGWHEAKEAIEMYLTQHKGEKP